MKKLKTKFISVIVFCLALVILVSQSGCQVAQKRENALPLPTATIVPSPSFEALKPKENRQWIPGNYLGITLGKSTREDVIRKFGKPEAEGDEASLEEEAQFDEMGFTMSYKNIVGGLGRETDIVYRKKDQTVTEILVFPDKRLTEKEIIAKYGDNYLRVNSGDSMCAVIDGNNPKQPLPKEAEGNMVYPELGMYVAGQIYFWSKCGDDPRE